MEINDADPILTDAANIRTEESIFVMKPTIRTILLILALASVSGLAGCYITLESVNLDRVEYPRQWDNNYRGGRVEEPAGH